MPLDWLTYLTLGTLAGLLAGLLGVGGGLILVAALAWLLPTQGVPASAAMHAALATSLASIILTATASTRAHHRRGAVLWVSVAWLLPGLIIGSWLGANLASHLSDKLLRQFVALYCVLAAAQLSLNWPRTRPEHTDSPRGGSLTLTAIVIGTVSALVGIGGGSMTVPLLTWRGVPAVRAVGTSSACGIGIGLASVAGYASQTTPLMPTGSCGYVYLPAAIGISIASVLAAPYGVRLAHWISARTLKGIFAGFLLLVAVLIVH